MKLYETGPDLSPDQAHPDASRRPPPPRGNPTRGRAPLDLALGIVVVLDDDRVNLRIDLCRADDGLVEQFAGGDLLLPYEFGKADRVVLPYSLKAMRVPRLPADRTIGRDFFTPESSAKHVRLITFESAKTPAITVVSCAKPRLG